MKTLFQPTQLGNRTLKNKVVMAPMTRSRAIHNLANDLMSKYYAARASAGLIITEGVSPSPNGLGYPRIPGLFNITQAESWKPVTASVHAKGGKIFVQLMHTGRVTNAHNLPAGAEVLSPSGGTLGGQMWTDAFGNQEHTPSKAMSEADIENSINEYVRSTELAMIAGFDGIELHGANGYLLEQFLNPNVNKRSDNYGNTEEGRMKFVLEVAARTTQKIGADRVGIRLSPYGVFNETGAFAGIDAFYVGLSKKLSDLGLAYLHVVDHSSMGAPAVNPELKKMMRQNFQGKFILSGGYDAERAEIDLIENKGDLVAFGRPFIANPDFVEKMQSGAALKAPDQSKFYTPGAAGYTEL